MIGARSLSENLFYCGRCCRESYLFTLWHVVIFGRIFHSFVLRDKPENRPEIRDWAPVGETFL